MASDTVPNPATNSNNLETEVRRALKAQGIVIPEPLVVDGKLHRYHAEGHRSGSRNIALTIHPDGIPNALWWDHKSGVRGRWRSDGCNQFAAVDPEEMNARHAARVREIQRRHLQISARVQREWAKARPCRGDGHPYLKRKGIKSHGLRIGTLRVFLPERGCLAQVSANTLMIPMIDAAGTIWAAQYILPDKNTLLAPRDKHFLAGSRLDGLYFPIGKRTPTVVIAEGAATATTIHERTGHHTLVAFCAGNLPSVAKIARAKYPQARIIIAADDDRFTDGNPGVRFATEAAEAVDGTVKIPKFFWHETGTDFNDLALLGRWPDEF